MIQGGDPTGKGTGGQSHWGHAFRDEFDLKGALKHTERGVMSMANSGAGTNGSQFFFTYRPTPHLDGKHTVFGGLVGGMEVLNALEKVTSSPATDRPLKEIKIVKVEMCVRAVRPALLCVRPSV
jgi:peptidyl-prolyl cis-trans isomerase-like protein 2